MHLSYNGLMVGKETLCHQGFLSQSLYISMVLGYNGLKVGKEFSFKTWKPQNWSGQSSPEWSNKMRKNTTVVASSKVRAIAAKLGLNIKEKKGEFKMYGDSIKRSIAVPNTKGGATRIYLVGFEATEGTVAHPKPPASTVTQMFDHSLAEKLILRAIYKAGKSLVVKQAKAPVTEEVVTSSPEVTEAPVEQAPELVANVG